MAKSIKPKFPLDREKTSEAFKDNLVSTQIYTTNAAVNIHIKGDYPENVISDLKNAVDSILEHHGK